MSKINAPAIPMNLSAVCATQIALRNVVWTDIEKAVDGITRYHGWTTTRWVSVPATRGEGQVIRNAIGGF